MPNPAAVEDAAPRRLKQDMLCQQWRRAGAAPPDLRRLAAVLARGTSRADSRHAQPRSPKGQRLRHELGTGRHSDRLLLLLNYTDVAAAASVLTEARRHGGASGGR